MQAQQSKNNIADVCLQEPFLINNKAFLFKKFLESRIPSDWLKRNANQKLFQLNHINENQSQQHMIRYFLYNFSQNNHSIDELRQHQGIPFIRSQGSRILKEKMIRQAIDKTQDKRWSVWLELLRLNQKNSSIDIG